MNIEKNFLNKSDSFFNVESNINFFGRVPFKTTEFPTPHEDAVAENENKST